MFRLFYHDELYLYIVKNKTCHQCHQFDYPSRCVYNIKTYFDVTNDGLEIRIKELKKVQCMFVQVMSILERYDNKMTDWNVWFQLQTTLSTRPAIEVKYRICIISDDSDYDQPLPHKKTLTKGKHFLINTDTIITWNIHLHLRLGKANIF